MSTTARNLLHWTPRVLGALYAVFISIFAFDVWGTGESFWYEMAGFLIHLIPTYLIVAALLIAWKNPRLGGILFIFLATAFGLVFGWREPETLLLLALPPTVVGLLFIADGCIAQSELRPQS